RQEPGVMAVWLQVHHSAEQLFAKILAERDGDDPDSLQSRIRAATLNAALRVAAEEWADRQVLVAPPTLSRTIRAALVSAGWGDDGPSRPPQRFTFQLHPGPHLPSSIGYSAYRFPGHTDGARPRTAQRPTGRVEKAATAVGDDGPPHHTPFGRAAPCIHPRSRTTPYKASAGARSTPATRSPSPRGSAPKSFSKLFGPPTSPCVGSTRWTS